MKKSLLLAPILLLSACVTINNNIGGKPVAANQPPNGIAMKPTLESVNFIDSADGNTYKWVKVRVYPTHPYNDVFIAPSFKTKATTPTALFIRVMPKTGSFKDERDGQIYKTVTLGKQTWMAQNLNFKTKEGALYYNNDPKNGALYGMLYNFYALPEACPKGWHVPTNAEWEELEYNAGMQKDEVIKDMFRGSIAANLLHSGATKMNVLFAGEYGRSRFYDVNELASFWTSTRESSPIVCRLFKKADTRICKNRNGEAYSLSVRCVKDSI